MKKKLLLKINNSIVAKCTTCRKIDEKQHCENVYNSCFSVNPSSVAWSCRRRRTDPFRKSVFPASWTPLPGTSCPRRTTLVCPSPCPSTPLRINFHRRSVNTISFRARNGERYLSVAYALGKRLVITHSSWPRRMVLRHRNPTAKRSSVCTRTSRWDPCEPLSAKSITFRCN